MNAKPANVMGSAPGGTRHTGNSPALIGRLVLAVALAAFLLLCVQPVLAQSTEHAAALRLLEKEQWEEAEKAFSAIADGEGVDPVALSGRAAARRNLGDAEGARSDVERVLAEYPEHAEAYYQRARVHMAEKRNDAALRDLNRAILLRSGHAPSYWQRADIHSQAGRHAEAVADYQKGVALRPRDLTALNNLAGPQLLNGDTLAAARLKAEDSAAAATFDSLRKRQQETAGGTAARVTSEVLRVARGGTTWKAPACRRVAATRVSAGRAPAATGSRTPTGAAWRSRMIRRPRARGMCHRPWNPVRRRRSASRPRIRPAARRPRRPSSPRSRIGRRRRLRLLRAELWAGTRLRGRHSP